MSATLLVDLERAARSGDAERVRAIAQNALTTLSPSGVLSQIAARAEASRRFDVLTAEFDADEKAVAYLDREGLLDELEDDLALLVPTIADGAAPVLAWAVPLLSGLAGPYAGFLSFGLQIACKVALAALQAWAKKRVLNIPKEKAT